VKKIDRFLRNVRDARRREKAEHERRVRRAAQRGEPIDAGTPTLKLDLAELARMTNTEYADMIDKLNKKSE
jgi:hypothetical protein